MRKRANRSARTHINGRYVKGFGQFAELRTFAHKSGTESAVCTGEDLLAETIVKLV
jgi:hypothetical protein